MGLSLGKIVKGVGKVAKFAAPVLAMTGVGLPLAAGIGAAGGLMSGGGVKGAVTGGLGGVAGGVGGAALSKVGGAGGVLGKLGGFIKGNPAQAAQLGLAGLSAFQGAKAQQKQGQINADLLGQIQRDNQGRDEIRRMALARLSAHPMAAPQLLRRGAPV